MQVGGLKLSILVCTLPDRALLLERLHSVLRPQIRARAEEVEVVTRLGTETTGAKRNALLAEARGEYVAFVDDDDFVSGDYVEKVLAATESHPDCVGISGVITFDNRDPRLFLHSIECDGWYEAGGIYFRTPNHLNPIIADIAREVGFADVVHGEDHDFSRRLRPRLRTEVKVERPVYFYLSRK
jgi:glycosyltransferase involved in cell wall biosynthesis